MKINIRGCWSLKSLWASWQSLLSLPWTFQVRDEFLNESWSWESAIATPSHCNTWNLSRWAAEKCKVTDTGFVSRILSSILSYPILSYHTLCCFRSNNTGQLVLLRHWLRHGHRHWTWSQESKVTNSPSSSRPLSSTISSAITKNCFQIKTKTPPSAKPTSLLWISGQRGSWLPQHFTWRGK